jgi:hypothetical protein
MAEDDAEKHGKAISRLSLFLLVASLGALLLTLFLNTWIVPLPPGQPESFFSLSTLSEFVKEIGFAAGIAFFLILTVERETRDEFTKQIQDDLQQIKENVFSGTFRRNFPADLLAEVEQTVFTKDFIRLEHDLHYDLRMENVQLSSGGAASVVRCHMSATSVSKNISAHPRDMQVPITVGKQPFEELNKRMLVELSSLEINGTRVAIPTPELHEDKYVKTSRYVIRNVPSGGKVKFTTSSIHYKLKNDYEVWRTATPILSFKLNINFPSEAHQFTAESIHRLELDERITGPCSRSYDLAAPLLCDQGIQFFWVCDDFATLSAAPVRAPAASISKSTAAADPTTGAVAEPSTIAKPPLAP